MLGSGNVNIVKINKIYKEYDDNVAVDGIDLTVKKGEILGILGPNGAGKSTLISMICGLINKDSGEVIYEESTKEISKWKKI